MVWARLWVKGKCPSGHNDEVSTYEWFDEVPSEEILKDYAYENASQSYQWDSERGCSYGFEVLESLPEKVRLSLIRQYTNTKNSAQRMLNRLNGKFPRKGGPRKPKPKTVWDRISQDDD